MDNQRPPQASPGTIGYNSLTVLGACRTVVDVDVPAHSPQLVVSGLFTPDSLWAVTLGRSTDITGSVSPEMLHVTDARVVITSNNDFADTLRHIGEGKYRTALGNRPIRDVPYTLRVETPDFPFIEASSRAPYASVNIVNVEPRASTDTPDTSNIGPQTLRFRLEDPERSNYYAITLFQILPVFSFDPVPADSLEARSIDLINIEPPFRYGYGSVYYSRGRPQFFSTIVFSDESFQGQVAEFDIVFDPESYDGAKMQFIFVFDVLSLEYFMHFSEFAGAPDDLLYDKEIGVLFYQEPPFLIHSNIHPGFGIFAGYSTQVFEFDLEGNVKRGTDWEL